MQQGSGVKELVYEHGLVVQQDSQLAKRRCRVSMQILAGRLINSDVLNRLRGRWKGLWWVDRGCYCCSLSGGVRVMAAGSGCGPRGTDLSKSSNYYYRCLHTGLVIVQDGGTEASVHEWS